ncbi:MAG: hypothetical protein ACI8ZZ_001790, partial [Gammaproteobacteria bacterium]
LAAYRSAIPIGGFQFIAHFSMVSHAQAPLANGRASDVTIGQYLG